MTITNGYCTVDDFKANFFPVNTTDSIDDAIIESKIEAISRLIDEETHRRFWKNSVAEARFFSPEYSDLLYTFDIVSITTLKTDEDGDRVYERTWATTDYDLEPENAALDGKPYTAIRTSPNGSYSFPVARRGVEITGIFGWNAVPKLAKEACLLQAIRLFKRKDAPFGVTGSAEMGSMIAITKLDPDVAKMLAPLIKPRPSIL